MRFQNFSFTSASAALVVGVLLLSTPAIAGGQKEKSAQVAKKADMKVQDPVCGMEVDPKTAEKAAYKGKTYYFCSRDEMEQFEKSPEKYVKPARAK